ncbi:hypothetical protein G6F31_020327 [Rhizopus arrhizus]|nr:hypothetical protein G6F31_020327 [Rhizopus arrhizus]
MRITSGIETRPEFCVVIAQIGRRQLVLGRKAAVQAGLSDAGLGHDGVDSDCPDPIAVEHFARGLADAVGRQQRFGCRLVRGGGRGGGFAGHSGLHQIVLDDVTDRYVLFANLNTYRSVK